MHYGFESFFLSIPWWNWTWTNAFSHYSSHHAHQGYYLKIGMIWPSNSQTMGMSSLLYKWLKYSKNKEKKFFLQVKILQNKLHFDKNASSSRNFEILVVLFFRQAGKTKDNLKFWLITAHCSSEKIFTPLRVIYSRGKMYLTPYYINTT